MQSVFEKQDPQTQSYHIVQSFFWFWNVSICSLNSITFVWFTSQITNWVDLCQLEPMVTPVVAQLIYYHGQVMVESERKLSLGKLYLWVLSLTQFDDEIANLQDATSFQYKDVHGIIKDFRKHLPTWLNRIFVSLGEGGLICATEVLDSLDLFFNTVCPWKMRNIFN